VLGVRVGPGRVSAGVRQGCTCACVCFAAGAAAGVEREAPRRSWIPCSTSTDDDSLCRMVVASRHLQLELGDSRVGGSSTPHQASSTLPGEASSHVPCLRSVS